MEKTELKRIRQNSNQHATALVCKYFKGSLEEATAQVVLISNTLVDSVYQGMEFPLKIGKTQEERIADFKANSDKNVEEAAERVASLHAPTEYKDLIG